MKPSNTIKIAALTAAIITLSACGGSTTDSAGTPAAGPSNGTITLNYQWPANTQSHADKALPPCAYTDKNKYSFNYSTGTIDFSGTLVFQSDSFSNLDIPHDELSDIAKGLPSNITTHNMPTGTVIKIYESDNSGIDIVPPPQCGTSKGHWTFSPDQVTLKDGEQKTITATFTPNP